RIDAALERFNLIQRRKDVVRVLSGGNRRRVELARALIHDPHLLIMDEATVGLDPGSRREILGHVRALRSLGMGILWTTHLIDEASQADRVIVLHGGKVVYDGHPMTLSSAGSASELTEAFLALVSSGH